MDYGDDPLISTRYAHQNAAAVRMVAPGKAQSITRLRNRHVWRKCTLKDLRDQMVTASMLVTAGVKWGSLVQAHGVDALLQHGFRWHDMLACGFAAQNLCSLTSGQRAQLGINATRALECRPGIREISGLGLGASELVEMGWTLPLLQELGLNAANMVDFGLPLRAWIEHMGVRDFGALGFDTYANCAAAGWNHSDIKLALNAPKAARVAPGGGAIRFI